MVSTNFIFNLNRPKIYYLKIVDIFLYPLFLIVLIIFKILDCKLLNNLDAVGHQVGDLECFTYEKKKKILILGRHPFIANEYFFYNYQKKKFKNLYVLKNYLVCLVLHLLIKPKKFRKHLTYYSEDYMSNELGKYNQIFKKNISLNFYKKRKNLDIVKNFLEKKNYNSLKNRIVVLHCRSNHFKNDGETYRSVDINSFYKTISWLSNNKFLVIKFGNNNLRIKKNIKNYIDLDSMSLNKRYYEKVSIELIANCFLFLGTNSGPILLGSIFDKPTLLTNATPFDHCLVHGKKTLSIFKFYRNKLDNDIIKISSIKKFNINTFRRDKLFNQNQIKVIDNTPDDILNATKEIIKKIKNNDFKHSNIQKKFLRILGKKAFSSNSSGIVAESFLKKYKSIIFH